MGAAMRVASVIAISLALMGCATSHTVYMMGRNTGVTGGGTVPANGRNGGPITIQLGGKDYVGRWVYMQAGGSLSLGSATAFDGGQVSTASGTFVGLPTGGNGNIMAAAADGATLSCVFNFSEWNLKGVGVCRDNKGETYDMQIN